MGRSIFQLAMYLGVALPLLECASTMYFWRGSLSRPWLFGVLGLVGLYLLMAATLTYAFSGIGFTGALSSEPQPAFDPLTLRYLSFLLGFLVGSAALLWSLRLLLAKR